MLKRLAPIAVMALLALFLAGLARFAFFRFSTGELYPEYSSLRADPFGTKALFESLRGLDQLTVSRNLESLQKLHADSTTTIFFLGLNGLPDLADFEQLARGGTRVFLALNAVRSLNQEREADRLNRWPRGNNNDKQPAEPTSPGQSFRPSGIQLRLIDPLRANTNRLEATRVSDFPAPADLSWYGRYCFAIQTNGWETVYEVKNKPVVIQRKSGLGTIVLCADSFLFSNEALARERSPEFLLWALGRARRIVIDETHLGIARGSSVMVLVREYRLDGLFFGLVLLAALWVWKNSFPFVPAYTEATADPGAIQGKTAREGVVHLLEQNLPVDQLPAICLREWSKSHPAPTSFESARLKEAEAALSEYERTPKKHRSPLEIYRRITDLLAK